MIRELSGILDNYKQSIGKVNDDWNTKTAAAANKYRESAYREWVGENTPAYNRCLRLLKGKALSDGERYARIAESWVSGLVTNVDKYSLDEIDNLEGLDLSGTEERFFISRYSRNPLALRKFLSMRNKTRSPLQQFNLSQTYPEKILDTVSDIMRDYASLISLYAEPSDLSSPEGISRQMRLQLIQKRFPDYCDQLSYPFISDADLSDFPPLTPEQTARIEDAFKDCKDVGDRIEKADQLCSSSPEWTDLILRTRFKADTRPEVKNPPTFEQVAKLSISEKTLGRDAVLEGLGQYACYFPEPVDGFDAEQLMSDFLQEQNLSGNRDNTSENETQNSDNTDESKPNKPENGKTE